MIPDVADDVPAPGFSDDYYQSGITARLAALTALSDVPDLFDGIEAQAEELVWRMLDLLED